MYAVDVDHGTILAGLPTRDADVFVIRGGFSEADRTRYAVAQYHERERASRAPAPLAVTLLAIGSMSGV